MNIKMQVHEIFQVSTDITVLVGLAEADKDLSFPCECQLLIDGVPQQEVTLLGEDRFPPPKRAFWTKNSLSIGKTDIESGCTLIAGHSALRVAK